MPIDTIILAAANIPVIAVLGSMAGGNLGASVVHGWIAKRSKFWASAWGRTPEILIALNIAAWAVYWWGPWAAVWLATLFYLLALVESYFAYENGHGNGYHDGMRENEPDRWQTLDYIVRPITNVLGFKPRSKWYCRTFMGIKGLTIGAFLFPFGLLLALSYPLSYRYSFRILKSDSFWAEILSAGSIGVVFLLIALAKTFLPEGIASLAGLV